MKIHKKVVWLLLASLITSSFLLTGFSDGEKQKRDRTASSGELTFTLRTVSAGGNYAPRHVLAIWVQSNNEFVKTRKAMANQRIQYLYTWAAVSNYNVVDAITGPTLLNHQTHTVSWDCTDVDGNIVLDGEYTVYAEFTDKHAQGPLYSINFMKGPDPQFINPPDETYFKDIELTFTPLVCDFSANETDICQDDTVIFTDESVNASSWEWDFGDGANPSSASTAGPHAVQYSTPGLKTVSLTINGDLTETKEDFIQANISPVANFSTGGSNLSVEFYNASINAADYFWNFGDGMTSTDENPVHTYSAAGIYAVSLTAISADCSHDTIQEVMVPLVGLEEITGEKNILVFPNPCSDFTRLRVTHHPSLITRIDLYSISGVKIEGLIDEVQKAGEHEFEIDMSKLPAGMYYFRFQAGEQTSIEKVLKID
jgi:PKD repeat protein